MDRVSVYMIYGCFLALVVNSAAAQTVHVVGDSIGWRIPPNTSFSYSSWASAQTFMIGDILVFNFMTNEHDVVQVPKASYDECSDDDAIGSVIASGPANITLNSVGELHYICSIGRHCEAGQKLSITVVSSSTPAPPMATPTPTTPSPPATPQPDACAPTPKATPPRAGLTPPASDSASVSLAASFLLIILSATLAFTF